MKKFAPLVLAFGFVFATSSFTAMRAMAGANDPATPPVQTPPPPQAPPPEYVSVNYADAQAIKQAVIDDIGSMTFHCVEEKEGSQTQVTTESASKLIESINQGWDILRKSVGQPLYKFESKDTTNDNYILISTDPAGIHVTSIVGANQLGRSENLGTVANPDYEIVWRTTLKNTCTAN